MTMKGSPVKLAFLDTETTGLADDCDVWEIGLILREPGKDDAEYAWQLVPNMATAEPTGLRIGRYYERLHKGLTHQSPGQGIGRFPITAVLKTEGIAADVARLLDGATIVGAVPDFDTRHLARFLRQHNEAGTWHYHLVDVETLAAGALCKPPPWDFDALLEAYGLSYDEADRHTALGDARMVRDLYDAVLTTPVPVGFTPTEAPGRG